MLAAAGVVVEDGRLLLVRDTHGFWASVGGWIEPGESPDEAVLREVKEEIGVEANITRAFRPFIAWNVAGADEPVSFVLFLFGLQLRSQDFKLQEGEVTDINWAEPGQLDGLPMLPYIRATISARLSEWLATTDQSVSP